MSVDSTADLLLSFLEYRASYREPIFQAWDRYGDLALAVFRAFQQWNISLDSIYAAKQSPANANEIQMSVDLFEKRMTFNVGLGAATLFVNNPSWSEANLIGEVVEAGVSAVTTSAGAEIDKQQVTLAMHLKPTGRSPRDILSKFVVVDGQSDRSDEIRGYGMALYRDDGYWIVDNSGLYLDSLFIKLQRSFGSLLPFDDLAGQFHEDENNLLQTLGLRLE
jgi:hypothetical protein